MTSTRQSEQYLRHYAVSPQRTLLVGDTAGVERVVVIPVLAEKDSLFKTLASLAANPAGELARTLVICVVNNHAAPRAAVEDIRDNQQTLARLTALLPDRRVPPASCPPGEDFALLAGSGLRLGVIDASSPGQEISERDGGVGTARKIGMDAALELLMREGRQDGEILSLDADTLVEGNYLSAVSRYFAAADVPAAVVAYAHQIPVDPEQRRAICAYEIFLRCYVLGLRLAGSPYAFHAIGSTMVCTAGGYTSVRGMNRREAAEDFHFLNKLAKVGGVGVITDTTVYPSARVSHRVPFGTGRQMQRSALEGAADYRVHHPAIFAILAAWVTAMVADPDREPEAILATAHRIHPSLADFLQQNRFADSWERIRHHARNGQQLRRQFHIWFDGLRTLRLVHHLSRSDYPPVGVVEGVAGLLKTMPPTGPRATDLAPDETVPGALFDILECLRTRYPDT
jgi:hypothetical protein